MQSCFDSHVHLDFAPFDGIRTKVIERARQSGVGQMFVPGCAPEQWRTLLRLQNENFGAVASDSTRIFVGVGLHPYFTDDLEWSKPSVFDELMSDMAQYLSLLGAVGLGEIGLDKARGAPLDQQVEIFEAQLELGRQRSLPLVLHQVGRQREFLEALRRVGVSAAGGVVHGFSGDVGWAKVLMKMGFFLGVGAKILHPARRKLRATVAQLPLDRLVVETDAPDGRVRDVSPDESVRSEPMDLHLIVARLAELLSKSEKQVCMQTTDNAERLFSY